MMFHKSLFFSLVAIAIFASPNCKANLCITLQETAGDGIEISWTGSGTFVDDGDADPNETINRFFQFNNFGSIFASSVGGASDVGDVFSLASTGLIITTVNPATNASTQVSFDQVRFDNETDDDLDVIAPSGTTFQEGDSYTFAGSSQITGAVFSDLVVGSFTSTEGVDVDSVGGTVKLDIIAAVPEPSTLTLFASATVLCIGRRRRRSFSTTLK